MIRLENLLLPDRNGMDGVGLPLDLSVPAGGFRWLVGPSGAGKTACLDVVALRRHPVSGRAHVLGLDLRRAGRRQRAGLRRRLASIRDEPDLLPQLTLGENIVLPLLLRRARPATARREVLDIADWLGFADRLDRPAAGASRGERQLSLVARAVASRPEIVLADEPALALGERDGARVILLLAELNRLGTTVLAATREDWTRRLHAAPEIALPGGGAGGASLVPW